jgi:hypothetical protein
MEKHISCRGAEVAEADGSNFSAPSAPLREFVYCKLQIANCQLQIADGLESMLA